MCSRSETCDRNHTFSVRKGLAFTVGDGAGHPVGRESDEDRLGNMGVRIVAPRALTLHRIRATALDEPARRHSSSDGGPVFLKHVRQISAGPGRKKERLQT